MKNYTRFINERFGIESPEANAIAASLKNTISRQTNIKLYGYGEEFIVYKQAGTLTGKLFMCSNGGAIRMNFNLDVLHSIDKWDKFSFDPIRLTPNPDVTLTSHGASVPTMTNLAINLVNGDYTLSESDSTAQPEFTEPEHEIVKLKSMNINKTILDKEYDIFEAVTLFSKQVVYGISNSLIISGVAGVGKSYSVEKVLEETKAEFKKFGGDISTAALYEDMFVNNGKLLVFDDCDAVWSDEDSVNMLKNALDTKKNREVTRSLKTHFNSEGMSYNDMLTTYKETGKLPKQFTFTGRCIFITNVDGKDLDPALISRSLHTDVQLTKQQVITRLNNILTNMFPGIKPSVKEETLDFVVFLSDNYDTKFPLSIRTMIHALNIRISNDFPQTIDGVSIPAWQPLIKVFLTKVSKGEINLK